MNFIVVFAKIKKSVKIWRYFVLIFILGISINYLAKAEKVLLINGPIVNNQEIVEEPIINEKDPFISPLIAEAQQQLKRKNKLVFDLYHLKLRYEEMLVNSKTILNQIAKCQPQNAKPKGGWVGAGMCVNERAAPLFWRYPTPPIWWSLGRSQWAWWLFEGAFPNFYLLRSAMGWPMLEQGAYALVFHPFQTINNKCPADTHRGTCPVISVALEKGLGITERKCWSDFCVPGMPICCPKKFWPNGCPEPTDRPPIVQYGETCPASENPDQDTWSILNRSLQEIKDLNQIIQEF